jgi:hypothetical protein
LIRTATFPLERVLHDAFDSAWHELSPDVDPEAVEAARWELATIVLGLSGTGLIDGDRLKADAVLSYRLNHWRENWHPKTGTDCRVPIGA